MRPIVGGDPGGHALSRFDGEREIRAVLAMRIAHHQRQAQLPTALLGERETDQASTEPRHEIDVLGAHLAGRHHEITLVLAMLIVHDHDHLAGGKIGEDVFDAVETTAHQR